MGQSQAAICTAINTHASGSIRRDARSRRCAIMVSKKRQT
jgi:hypothetical protein